MSSIEQLEPASNPASNAAIVLGLIAVGVGVVPFLGLFGAFPAVLAVLFGIAGARASRRQPNRFGRARSVTGIVLGILGILLATSWLFWSGPENVSGSQTAGRNSDGTVAQAERHLTSELRSR